MGPCQNTNKKMTNPSNNIEQNLAGVSDEMFADMPLWEGERFRGQGIKRMQGYKCEIPIDELNKIREEFWAYKISQNCIWRSIKQAVLMDDLRGSNHLESLRLKPIKGCINELRDHKGNIYKIPNYCINDPYFEKIIENDIGDKSNLREGKIIKIKLFDFYSKDNKTYEIDVDDNLTGGELKSIFIKSTNLNLNEGMLNSVRLFFGGGEILDNHQLYKHNVKNGYTVLVMIKV